jgi:hypothetical protein
LKISCVSHCDPFLKKGEKNLVCISGRLKHMTGCQWCCGAGGGHTDIQPLYRVWG